MLARARRARARIRRSPPMNAAYRVLVAVVGAAVVAAGLLLVPLPGPGWVIVFAGLGVWATEFAWAARLVRYARAQLRRWTAWIGRRTTAAKTGLGAGAAAALVGLVWLVLAVGGVPGWVPDPIARAVEHVPGITSTDA